MRVALNAKSAFAGRLGRVVECRAKKAKRYYRLVFADCGKWSERDLWFADFELRDVEE